MTKRQLRASKRPPRQQKQRRFHGWHWERRPRPGRHHFLGRCHMPSGVPLFVEFTTDGTAAGLLDATCRHCGKPYESVKPLRKPR